MNRLGRKDNETLIEMASATDGGSRVVNWPPEESCMGVTVHFSVVKVLDVYVVLEEKVKVDPTQECPEFVL
ncbi:UNVERIFIED_CONTAM: hypothetical protein K2H54_056959 [Gekko kuhli]